MDNTYDVRSGTGTNVNRQEYTQAHFVSLSQVADLNKRTLREETDPTFQFLYIDLGSVNHGSISYTTPISFGVAPSRARRLTNPGDILLGTVRPLLLAFAQVPQTAIPIVASTGFAVITPKSSQDWDFLYHSLYGRGVLAQIERLVTGSSYPAITSGDVAELRLCWPETSLERRQIAKILSTWGTAIEHTEKLITAKERLTKALSQQLLSGKRRLANNRSVTWRTLELASFLEPVVRPIARPCQAYRALGLRSHGKGTFEREVEDPNSVMMETLFEVRSNDLIVNITFAWEGAIALVRPENEGCLVSHRFPTYRIREAVMLPAYLRHLITTKRMVYELGLVSPGGAGRNRVLSKTEFLGIEMKVPPIEEQRELAAVLDGCDEEIALLKSRLSALRRQKQGLMQVLLTGKVRVPVGKEAEHGKI